MTAFFRTVRGGRAATLAILLLGACKMGPEFAPPEPPAPEVYRADPDAGESIANTPWWKLYRDPCLQELIELGLEDNRSLREALARIAEARASLGMVKADLYPNVNAIGVGFYQETGRSDSVSSFDNFKAAAAASYEVDLWGRIARSNEAALQSVLATEEAYRTVTIGLVAEIAEAYMVLRDLDARLAIAVETVASRGESVQIVRVRAQGGLVPLVDVRRSEIELADAEATVQALLRARARTENGISLLVGKLPSSVTRGAALTEQALPPSVPAGLPSELVQRRPDILAAERMLHAQTARIGVAEALRFPSFSLTASLGVKSTSLGEATSQNTFLNLGANITGSIFNAGRNKARVEMERARTEQLLNQYDQTVLNAFREVEDALVGVETFRTEYDARLRQLEAAHEAVDVAWARYDGGLTSYMEVLDLQRSLFGTQLKASEALQQHHSAVIQLYRALGGGWNVEERHAVAAVGKTNRHWLSYF